MEDDARSHTTRGSPARTTTASDEARARMETIAAVKKVYIIKQTLSQRRLVQKGGIIPSLYIRVKPELVRMDGCLLKEFTHMVRARMNDWQHLLYSHCGKPHVDVAVRLMTMTMTMKHDYPRTTSAGKVRKVHPMLRKTPGKVASVLTGS